MGALSSLRIRWLIAAAVAVSLAVAAWLASAPLMRRLVMREARAYGVELQFERASYSSKSIALEECVITLHGVAGLTVQVERLTIQLEEWKPRALEAEGMRIDLEGSSLEFRRALRGWRDRNHRNAAPEIPSLAARLQRVTWSRDGDEWLVLEEGTLNAAASQFVVDADKLVLFHRGVGPFRARIEDGRAFVSLALGGEIDRAPVTLVVDVAGEPIEADIALEPTPLARLASPFGVALPEDLSAAGNAHVRFTETPERGAIQGRAHAQLEGYVPPVPIEIKKLAFGKITEIETLFETSDDRELVSFGGTRVAHGVLGLDGGGTIERREGRAVLHAVLEGRLLCRDVAASAASAHAEGPLATWLSDLGRATLRGSVSMRVVLDADFARLREARIVPTIGVGCGLRLP